jgi:hypothetical protein
MAAAQAVHAESDFALEATPHGDAVEVQAHAQLDTSAQLVWQVINDYEHLPQFMPGIRRSVVLARDGNRVVVEQSGEARSGIFAMPIEVRYQILERAPKWIMSYAVGDNLRRMSSRYEIRSVPGRAAVVLHYVGTIEPAFRLPPVIGIAALHAYAEDQFRAVVREINRRAAEQRSKAG